MEQIARAPKNVRIYSPYLTSDVAETVIKAADQTTAQVFTTFKAETFATGGSSIETLRSVFDSQFQIFSVPDLHAKIVITDCAILIGSQNLTRGGTKNREATAILTDADEIQALRDALKSWDKHKLLITKQMIDYMEREVAELKTLFLPFQKRANEIDDGIKHKFLPDFPPKIVYPEKAKYSEKVRVKLTDLSYKDNRGQRRSYSALKVIGRDQSLLRWNLDGKSIDLKKTHRYPLFSKDNARVSWIALHNTQVTKFALQHAHPNKWRYTRRDIFFSHEIKPASSVDTPANLKIRLGNFYNYVKVVEDKSYQVVLDVAFVLGEIHLIKITERFDHDKTVKTANRLEDCVGEVKDIELDEITEPIIWPRKFKGSEWKIGNSLGDPPEKFLGDLGPVFDIQLIVDDEERETLVIEAVGQ